MSEESHSRIDIRELFRTEQDLIRKFLEQNPLVAKLIFPPKPEPPPAPPAPEADPPPPEPTAEELLVPFWEELRASRSGLLLLDYDGTLASFKVNRMAAVPYEGVREAVERIMATNTRIGLISGRIASEVEQLLGLNPAPVIWGCHGWEMRVGGVSQYWPLSEGQKQAMTRAEYILRNEGLMHRIEKKYGSLALHWRGVEADAAVGIRQTGIKAMTPFTGESLAVREFDGGIELRATGRDKGEVVRDILTMLPADDRIAYLGDDQTDEDAFRALEGRGVSILVRPEKRATVARVWLRPPEELMWFLEMWEWAMRN